MRFFVGQSRGGLKLVLASGNWADEAVPLDQPR
jgi:hypothetical protein